MAPQLLNISGRPVRLCQCATPAIAVQRALSSSVETGVCWSVSDLEGSEAARREWSTRTQNALRDAGGPDPQGQAGPPRQLKVGNRTLWWSLSHSGSLGVFAIADVHVAIDVEQDRSLRATARVRDRMASADEWQLAHRFFGEQPTLGLWTAKEAVAKGRGTGILEEFRRFRWQPVDADSSRIDVVPDSHTTNTEQWMLWHQRLAQAWISFAIRADDA